MIIEIKGMMCMHCENRVRKTIEGIEGVESVVVSHEKGTAEITFSSPVSDDILKGTIEAQGYPVLEIK